MAQKPRAGSKDVGNDCVTGQMDRSDHWSPNNRRSGSTCAADSERAPLLPLLPPRSASICVAPCTPAALVTAVSSPETASRPVEIRRKESIKPPPSAQEINGILSNGSLGIAINDGLSPYRDVVNPALLEEEEDDTQLAVTCRVCNNEIIIEKEEGFVVKCGACNEATPIRNAPVGEKYVRCPCHCLLICKDNSERIACPRENCKRIITITAAPVVDGAAQSFAPPHSTPGTCHVVCVHCGQEFLFNILHKSLAKCPHCSKISAVGNVYRRRQLRVYTVVAFLFILVTVLVILGTYFLVAESGGIVALYVGLVAVSVLAVIRVIYFFRMKVSEVQATV